LISALYRSVRNVRPLVAVVDSEAAGTDVTCSVAQRAGVTITEVDSSHVMVSQHPAVTDVILEAVAAVGSVSRL
jgi:hypothetical protein